MKLTIRIYILISFALSGCKTDAIKVSFPIEEEKVIELLGDMHYADAAANLNRKLNIDSLKQVYTNQVFEIHGVDSTVYNEIVEILENDLNRYYLLEQKVHSYIKGTQNKSGESPKK